MNCNIMFIMKVCTNKLFILEQTKAYKEDFVLNTNLE